MPQVDKAYRTKRHTVYLVDGGRCHICKRKVRENRACLDHVVPRATSVNGDIEASDESWNLRIAHRACNARRAAAKVPGQIRLFNVEGKIVQCPECKATQTAKAGFTWRGRERVQRWRCLACGRVFTETEKLRKGSHKG